MNFPNENLSQKMLLIMQNSGHVWNEMRFEICKLSVVLSKLLKLVRLARKAPYRNRLHNPSFKEFIKLVILYLNFACRGRGICLRTVPLNLVTFVSKFRIWSRCYLCTINLHGVLKLYFFTFSHTCCRGHFSLFYCIFIRCFLPTQKFGYRHFYLI